MIEQSIIDIWAGNTKYDSLFEIKWNKYLKEIVDYDYITWHYIKAQAIKESSLNPEAIGDPVKTKFGVERAIGLMQILPSTAKLYSQQMGKKLDKEFDLSNEIDSVDLACYIMADLYEKQVKSQRTPLERYKFALACYNAGIGNIRKAQKLAVKKDPGIVSYKKHAMIWDDTAPLLHKITGDKNAEETIYYVDFILELGLELFKLNLQ